MAIFFSEPGCQKYGGGVLGATVKFLQCVWLVRKATVSTF